MTDTFEEKLQQCGCSRSASNEEPPWMAGFGALSDLADENRRVLELIEEEFERLPPKDSASSSQPD